MKKTYFIVLFSFSFSFNLFANDWSTDDWGQWVNEEMTDMHFSNDSFDQLNELDGISNSSPNKQSNDKQLLPNDVLFQLWQLENGLQFIDMEQLTSEEKALYKKWLEQSNYESEEIDPSPLEQTPNNELDIENNQLNDLPPSVSPTFNLPKEESTPETDEVVEPSYPTMQSNAQASNESSSNNKDKDQSHNRHDHKHHHEHKNKKWRNSYAK